MYGLLKRITYPNGGYVEYDWAMQPYFDADQFSVLYPNGGGGQEPYDPTTMQPLLPYYLKCVVAYDWPAVAERRVSFDGTHVALKQDFQYTSPSWFPIGGQRTTTVTTVDNIAQKTSKTIYTYNMVGRISNDPLQFVPAYGLALVRDENGGTDIQPVSSTPLYSLPDRPEEQSIVYEDGSGNVLKTVSKTWLDSPDEILTSETDTLGSSGPTSTTTYQRMWPGRTPQTTFTNYDGSYTTTAVAYYNWGATGGDPASTAAQWLSAGHPIFDLPQTVTVSASGTTAKETDYSNYDGNGNVGTITQKCTYGTASCTNIPYQFLYDAYGNVTQKTDAYGNSTQYGYTDDFISGDAPTGNTNAYLTQITYPPIPNQPTQTETFAYDYASGHLMISKDVNGNPTTYQYNDPLGRPTEVDFPDGGKTAVTYNDDGANPSITKQVAINSSSMIETTLLDGFRHAIEDQLVSDPAGTDYTDTTYDGFGRVYTVSNPYRTSSDPTNGLTTYNYDSLGRASSIVNPDTSTKTWAYNANVTTYCDEANRCWQNATDGLGRLTNVIEPAGSSTSYIYDTLNNLLNVTQLGLSGEATRARSFTYDSLSQLITSQNPETGTTCYGQWSGGSVGSGNCQNSYNSNGNLLYKTDARGSTTSYTYDALNRLTGKGYSDGQTPVSCYQYNSSSVKNGIGRLANTWTQPAGTTCSSSPVLGSYLSLKSILAYDPMGRPKSAQQQQCVNGKCSAPSPYSLSMVYDLAGNMTQLTNSVGARNSPLTLTNYFDNAGRPCLTTSSWSAGFSQNLFQVNPSVSGYWPFGKLQNWYLGSNSSTTSIGCSALPSSQMNLQQGFDKRLRVTSFSSTGQVP